MEGFFKLLAEVWEEGLLGIGLTEIFISISIVAVAFILRAFVVNIVFQWVESLAD